MLFLRQCGLIAPIGLVWWNYDVNALFLTLRELVDLYTSVRGLYTALKCRNHPPTLPS